MSSRLSADHEHSCAVTSGKPACYALSSGLYTGLCLVSILLNLHPNTANITGNSPVLAINGSWLIQFYLTENCYIYNISFWDPLALSKQNTLTRHFSCANNNNHKNIFSNCRLSIFTQNVNFFFSDRGHFFSTFTLRINASSSNQIGCAEWTSRTFPHNNNNNG